MTTHKYIISGFGGQGVMSMGMMLAYAGMLEDKEVTWLPSYGPEMRGGTANCSVVISDKPISSPVVTKATSVITMNLPSLIKFQDNLKEGGNLFINSSLIDEKASRKDVHAYYITANDMALVLGNDKTSNMIMLGAVLSKTATVSLKSVEKVLEKLFKNKQSLIPLNIKALNLGYETQMVL